jgi:hypothetical protein
LYFTLRGRVRKYLMVERAFLLNRGGSLVQNVIGIKIIMAMRLPSAFLAGTTFSGRASGLAGAYGWILTARTVLGSMKATLGGYA